MDNKTVNNSNSKTMIKLQNEFPWWDKVVDKKLQEAKEQRLKRRNDWVKTNIYQQKIINDSWSLTHE